MNKLLYVIFFSLFNSSCVVGPNYTKEDLFSDKVIQKELNLNKPYRISKKWYEHIKDPQLNKLIDTGLQKNTDISIAIERLKQARVLLNINQVQYLPQINAQGGYNYEKNSKNIKETIDSHYYTAGFDASWEIDLWGKTQRQREADIAKVESLKYNLDNVRVTIISEIASIYIKMLVASEKLRITQNNLNLQKEIYKIIKQKYTNNLIDDITYNQAEYLVSTINAQIPLLETDIENYKNALSTIIGVLPSQLDINNTSSIFVEKYDYNTHMVYNLPANIIRNRPDVASAEQTLISKNALIGKAITELYPNVNITAFFGYASQGGTNLFSPQSQSFNYSPLISIPLLDWNRIKNNIKIQEYIKQEAFIQYQKTVLNAIAELKNAMNSFQNNVERNKTLAKALKNIQQATSLSRNKYKNGLLEYTELLNSEQNLLNAQNDYIESKGQIFQSLIAYYKATGAGY